MNRTRDKIQFINQRFTFKEFYFRRSGALQNFQKNSFENNPLYGIMHAAVIINAAAIMHAAVITHAASITHAAAIMHAAANTQYSSKYPV